MIPIPDSVLASIPEEYAHIEQGHGRALTIQTVTDLARMAREDSVSPRIRSRVEHLFVGLAPMDYDGEAEAIWRHVVDHVRYMHDPVTVAEWITRPIEMDKEIDGGFAAEDCENMALYGATLFAAAGWIPLFELQGKDPAKPLLFHHCALRVQHPATKRWISFDPVGADAYGEDAFTLGDSLHRPGEPLELWDLDGERVNMSAAEEAKTALGDALGDCGSRLGDTAATVVGILNDVGKTASNFGPYGQIVGGLLQTGTGIYDAATGRQVAVAVPPIAIAAPPPAARPWTQYGGGSRYVPPPPAKTTAGSTAVKVIGGGALAALVLRALV